MNLRRLRAIAVKEWIHIRRDPRSLVVALVLPLVLLLLNGYGLNFDLTDLPFALCDYDQSSTSRLLQESLVRSELFRLVGSVRSPAEAEHLIQDGDCLFALIIPPHLQADLAHGKSVAIQMLLDGSDANTASIARQYVTGALTSSSQRLVAEAGKRLGLPARATLPAITMERKILFNPGLDSRHFTVPGLIVVILVILGALLTSGAVVRERERGTFETLAASPLLASEILLGKLIPYLVLGFADVIIAVCTGALFFHVTIAGSLALFLACAFVFLLCALGFGLLISTIARTQQVAMTMAIVATLLPAINLSGFVFPVRNMPLFLKLIAWVIPPTHFLIIARSIYLKGVGLGVIWPQLVVLIVLAAVILRACLTRFRKQL